MARREALIRGATAPDEHEPAPGAPAADPSTEPPADEPRLSLFDDADLVESSDIAEPDVAESTQSVGSPLVDETLIDSPTDLSEPSDPPLDDEPLIEPSADLAVDEPPAEPPAVSAVSAVDPLPDAASRGPFLPLDDDSPLAELFPDDHVAEDATVLPEDATVEPDASAAKPFAAVRPRTRRRKEPVPKVAPAPSPWLDDPPPPSPPVVDHAITDPGHALAPPRSTPFVFDPLRPYRGVVRRFFVVYRHVLGLLAGGAAAYVRALPRERRHGLKSWFPRLTASIVWPFLDRDIRRLTFAQQLRRRLEVLGPTYIKLGQIMAIREDLLPRSITGELANLFDRLPAIPFVKVIKPGVAEMIESDLTLLGMVGGFLQWVLPRYQPRQIIREFSAYTRKEVDYTFEADNAETFAANFKDLEDVAFPRIHRALSSANVLTMEFMDGLKPGSQAAAALSQADRERVIDLGAASIIRMLYRDGFFHADLHAGNLMIFPGKRVKMGFIDLGMVGRFEERTRRQMLYYFHALVSGDVDGATRYLADMATVGKGGDPQGFRRAVTDLSRRFVTHAARGEISIAQLILESVGLGGRYRVFFPVEMTLMVKALVTFEGVGRTLDPQLDVAAVSQKHVSKIFQQQFDPRLLMRQILRGSPELVDMAVRLPQLLSAGFKFADEHLNNRSPANPLQGIKGSILAAACIVGGVLAAIQHASPLLWGGMFLMAVLFAMFGK